MKDKSDSKLARPGLPEGRPRRAAHKTAKATIKAILGREMSQPPSQSREKPLIGTSWHGQRKKRRSTYSIPGQTADALWLDKKLAP